MHARRLMRRLGATAFTVLAATGVGAASANAGVLVESGPPCTNQPLSKPFLPWLDVMSYTPLRGGDFEGSTAGWTLGGGAATAAGNEPFQVAGPGDARSLALPAGSSAVSPAICVGIQHPTLRFFARRTSGGLLNLSTLRVDVLFEDTLGLLGSLPIGVVLSTGSWQPTLPMLMVANLLPLLPGQHTAVAFRFTPMGSASWAIDDVFVDPYGRN